MDNLLDALQKGTAFNVREGARKRTPRTTGGKFNTLYIHVTELKISDTCIIEIVLPSLVLPDSSLLSVKMVFALLANLLTHFAG